MGKNTNHIQHIKSSVVVEGKPKLPQSGVLVEGELAINYADGYETISLENTSGEVVTFSSDDYYTEQKLGSGFTGVNSANTVTSVIESNERVTAAALNDLEANKLDASAYTPTDLSNYYTKDETSGKTEISNALGAKVNSATFTAHTADTTIHLTSGDVKSQIDNRLGSGFTSSSVTEVIEANELAISAALNDLESNKLDASAYTPTDLSNYYTKDETSGASEISTALNDKADKVSAFTDAEYNSTDKKIYFKNANGTTIDEIDASDFIIDGMVDDVRIEEVAGSGTCLVIDFNTASGKEDINIPISDIFDASNYYDKTAIDNKLGSGFTGANSGNTVTSVIESNERVTAAALNDLEANKLDASALNDYYTKENIDDKLGDEFIGENSGVTVTSVFQLFDNALLVLNHNINQVSGNTMFVSGNSYGSAVLVGDSGQTAIGKYSVAEGAETLAGGDYSHAEGYGTSATSQYSHAEGYGTIANMYSHAEGYQTLANMYSHAEGYETSATSQYSHAEGYQTIANLLTSHAEGYGTSATSVYTHAEGHFTLANAPSAHAEGEYTIANAPSTHAEGEYTVANNYRAHAEGYRTSATSEASHAEGILTIANAPSSHAEGNNTSALTQYSHAEGYYTITNNEAEHASGKYNVSSSASTTFGDSGNTLFSVGNGESLNRHNAFEIRQNGDIYIVSGGTDIKLQDHIGASITIDQAIDSGTSASTNAVSTSAVYGFVTSYTPSITVDQVLDDTVSASTNPVSSKAVYDAVTDNELVWTNAYVTMSGAVSSHTENTNIHVTSADKTAWNAKVDSSDLDGYADSVKYNSTSHYVEFYHGTTAGTKVYEFDASDFIIDGMVDDVRIDDVAGSGTCLVVDFNTASGKQDINIPISDIFDANNYYDKIAIDNKLGSGFTSSSVTEVIESNERVIASALNDLESNKLDASAYTPTDLSNYYTKDETSGSTELTNAFNEKVNVSDVVSAITSENSASTAPVSVCVVADNEFIVSAALNDLETNKLDVSAYTPTDLSNYYTKSQTSGASEISTALSEKSNTGHTHTLSNITDITATTNAINSLTSAVGTMAFQNTSSYSSATEVNTALGNKIGKTINVIYNDLKALRDNSQLVPGQWYRITDYMTTTTQDGSRSAGHQFDIIVRADDANRLNENAFAAHHAGDTYFANAKVEAWELRYCLDNDTSRFAWANDDDNPKFVQIGGKWFENYMDGDVEGAAYPYCLKNGTTMYYSDKVVPNVGDTVYANSDGTGNSASIETVQGEGKGVIYQMIDEFNNDLPYDFKNIQYQVCKVADAHEGRTGLNGNYCFFPGVEASNMPKNISIPNEADYIWCYTFSSDATGQTGQVDRSLAAASGVQIENNYIRQNDTYFKELCKNVFFGNRVNNNNAVGNANVVLDTFYNNIFVHFENNVIQKMRENYIERALRNSFSGVNCYENIIHRIVDSSINGGIQACKIGVFTNCETNGVFGGNNVLYASNTYFGTYFQFNIVNVLENTIIEKGYVQLCVFEGYNKYLTLTSNKTTSGSSLLRNIKICGGVAQGTSEAERKTISHNSVNDTFQTEYKNANSVIINV